jgi:phosphoglycolate phosphatase-like HAD superfamily hydrolase
VIAYLFDIDGTLVRAGGAGARSLAAVFAARHGVADAARGVRFHGRTDRMIVRDMFRGALGREASDDEIERVLEDYLRELERMLPAWDDFRVLPDADETLRWLAAQPDVKVGIATGNVAGGARLKLARAGLEHHVGFGGYGCDSAVRAELVACAARRAGVGPGDTAIVVGDTVLDVEAAKANAMLCVGVTTGGDDRATLEASGADVVLDRLGDLPAWHRAQFPSS